MCIVPISHLASLPKDNIIPTELPRRRIVKQQRGELKPRKTVKMFGKGESRKKNREEADHNYLIFFHSCRSYKICIFFLYHLLTSSGLVLR